MNDIPKTWGEFLTLGESMRNAQKEYFKNHKAWNSSEYLECSKELEKKFDDAIKYILWFFRNNIGMEHTNYKRVEMKALVDSALECSNHNYGESINQQSKKHEAHTLKGVGSSRNKPVDNGQGEMFV